VCLIDDDQISRRYDYRNVKLTQMRWRTLDLRTSATVLPVVELSSSPVLIAVRCSSTVVVVAHEGFCEADDIACMKTRIWCQSVELLLRVSSQRACRGRMILILLGTSS
jgi:hypothetical protein